MADQDPIAFTRGAADRIANAVRTVEIGNRRSGGIEWDTQLPSAPVPFKMCTFTGSWSKGTSHVTTFYNVTTTPNTVTAINLFVDVGACTSSVSTAACAIARYAGQWYLIAAECGC